VKEAEKMMNKFFSTFPGLRRVRNWAYKEMDRKAEVIEARNLVGFRRVLEGHNRKPTSLLNTIIQSTAGHGIKAAFPYLMEEGLLPFLCLQVHDELLFEFPEEDAEDFTRRAEACLVQGMRDVLGSTAPVKVKANTGAVWL
jgi:DNA polymerase-1